MSDVTCTHDQERKIVFISFISFIKRHAYSGLYVQFETPTLSYIQNMLRIGYLLNSSLYETTLEHLSNFESG